MIPKAVRNWCVENDFGEIRSSRPVGGGCINEGAVLHTDSGKTFFLKTNTHIPGDMFTREAEGLEELRAPGGPRARPFLPGPDFLLLEDLKPAPRIPDYWPAFGRQLARLHDHTRPQFGFHHDNYIGSTPQPNPGLKMVMLSTQSTACFFRPAWLKKTGCWEELNCSRWSGWRPACPSWSQPSQLP
jgi:fructosamine-3-kinase